MNTKRTHPTEATVEQVETGAGLDRSTTSTTKHITPSPSGQGFRVADLLSHGAGHGQTITDLERLTGCRSREIRKQIERERRAGALIISDNQHGYFLTDDPAEAQRFARSMLHRSREITRTARAVEKAAGLL